MTLLQLRSIASLLLILPLSACGGSSSETPYPLEPSDVQEQEGKSDPQDEPRLEEGEVEENDLRGN